MQLTTGRYASFRSKAELNLVHSFWEQQTSQVYTGTFNTICYYHG